MSHYMDSPPVSPQSAWSTPRRGGSERGSSTGTRTSASSDQIYSDRFIPSRSSSRLETGFCLLDDVGHSGTPGSPPRSNTPNSQPNNAGDSSGKESQPMLNMLLRSELLGVAASSATKGDKADCDRPCGFSNTSTPVNLFRFKSTMSPESLRDPRSVYELSPVGGHSKRLLSTPRKTKRKIPKVPFKVLDAPALQDDFYLNLVDWSALNVLAVGLGSCVYLWSACTSKVTKLCDLGQNDCVTSVAWTQRGTHLAVGTNQGEVEIWEAARCKKVRTMGGHTARIGTMSWNAHTLASGSRDRLIFLRDVRIKNPLISKLAGHKQEVCGLRWSFDETQLASGGNDNKLFIWTAKSSNPLSRFHEHTAAVKAIAWSPHQHGLLASGGGTADRCIRFWNTLTSVPLNCVDTGSQVCNLMWSRNVNELVSTHGYSLNQIIVWRYPFMSKVATLTGHTYRVLYLAMSPDGQTIVTGAGDETLRFWNAFPSPKSKDGSQLGSSLLFPSGIDLR